MREARRLKPPTTSIMPPIWQVLPLHGQQLLGKPISWIPPKQISILNIPMIERERRKGKEKEREEKKVGEKRKEG